MFYYRHLPLVSSVLIIGTGGTGGRLVPYVTQLLSTIDTLKSVPIHLWDFDIVESKNLRRQLFLERDIGSNKATVLAERYGAAFGVNIHAHAEAFTEASLDSLRPDKALDGQGVVRGVGDIYAPLIFLCVDSMAARREILKTIHWCLPLASLIVDAGNEDTFGQIRVFNNTLSGISDIGKSLLCETGDPDSPLVSFGSLKDTPVALPSFLPFQYQLPFLPFPTWDYVNASEEVTGTGSCADMDQTMAINCQMAVAMLQVLQAVVFGLPIRYHTLRYNIEGGNCTEWTNRQWFENLLTQLPRGNDQAAEFFYKGRKLGDVELNAMRGTWAGFIRNMNLTILSKDELWNNGKTDIDLNYGDGSLAHPEKVWRPMQGSVPN